jgi:aminomethyltransferase
MGGGGLVRTALYDEHAAAGANLVDFHGFELPIWYSSITEEHLATRAAAGLFDVSHMGFFRFSGEGVLEWLEGLATQRVRHLKPGRCAYTHFLDGDGFIIDDMIFSIASRQNILDTGCTDWESSSEVAILGVPNASMISTMAAHFGQHLPTDGSLTLEDLSQQTSILALQGPTSPAIVSAVLGVENVVRHFRGQPIRENCLGIGGWIQGTGYTGERGFEIMVANESAPSLWRALLEGGAVYGICPVGLGARDTLRLEKGFLLSGQDFLWPPLSDSDEHAVDPSLLARDSWETNVPFGLHLEHEFLGKQRVVASAAASEQGEGARWWGVRQLEKGPFPRPGAQVLDAQGEQIGTITSGGPSPSLDRVGIGMGYISGVTEGDEVLIAPNPRKQVRAVVVRAPFL